MNTKPLPENSSMMANTDAAGYPIFRPKRKRPKLAEQQETMAEHSPLPWSIGEDGDVFSESYCVAKVVGAPDETPQGKANAAYIVKACNEYEKVVAQRDELLAACKNALNWLVSYPGSGADKAYEKCKAAIANASKPADPFTDEKLHEMGCSYDREQIDGGE